MLIFYSMGARPDEGARLFGSVSHVCLLEPSILFLMSVCDYLVLKGDLGDFSVCVS